MTDYHSPNLTETELAWIIDALVSGRLKQNKILSEISKKDLEKILIRLGKKISVEQKTHKPNFPDPWGITNMVLKFERAMGLPDLDYFSKPFLEDKGYF
ncbi:hypothetical protein GF327_02055 [Candidatus Woesearchaeota archaeon]|nr:hypothetical protein [Candidatus Woesearchaeota archaeon]